jgi:hypothetical protein
LLFMDKLSCQKSTRSGFLLIINFWLAESFTYIMISRLGFKCRFAFVIFDRWN